MDTTPRSTIQDVIGGPVELTTSLAETYLDALSREQARFLAATSDARRALADDDGQLGAVAALHGRLTQQFFDAQRAILRRRAETDGRVRAINEGSESEASRLLDLPPLAPALDAHSACRFPTLDQNDQLAEDDDDGEDRSIRQQIADLVTAMVRPGDDVDAIATVVDDAFVPDEPDGDLVRRDLQGVLDQWWDAERQETQASIDDANARAAMRRHLAMVQSGRYGEVDEAARPGEAEPVAAEPERWVAVEPAPVAVEVAVEVEDVPTEVAEEYVSVVGSIEAVGVAVVETVVVETEDVAAAAPRDAPEAAAPLDLLAVLDDGDDQDLDHLLASLLDALGGDDVAPLPPPTHPAPSLPVAAPIAGPIEPFEQFWSPVPSVPAGPAPEPARRLMSVHVMLPAVGLISALALLMAWLG